MEGSAVVCAAWKLSSLNQKVLGSNPAKFLVEMLTRGAKDPANQHGNKNVAFISPGHPR